DRTNYDLTQHMNESKVDMTYYDQEKNTHYVPFVIEPSLGADRVALAFLVNAYDEEVVDPEKNDVRTVLRLHPFLAPFKCAVLPLQKNKLGDKAKEVYAKLAKKFMCEYDETGSIGKRYRRQDEAGTPFCVTVDFDTLETNKVTVRERDSMEQTLVDIDELPAWIEEKLDF
ncbi:MAG: glycine--tRNA ligase, partial [Clostridia bacterium]|nr:glycine--tRNA ligase [Clostridia bacterium]